MQEEIIHYIDSPSQLEKMYRSNRLHFRRAFETVYPELRGNPLAECWNERLHYDTGEINWGTRAELLFVIIASFIAGSIAKLPFLLSIDQERFYTRNIGFIIFPVLMAYFGWKNKIRSGVSAFILVTSLVSLVFINYLPNVNKSDTLYLSCIHLLLILWSLLGVAFVGTTGNAYDRRLSYLQFNGDLVVMTTLIVIAGGIMTAITIGLFRMIGFNIESFYFDNIVVFGLPAAPIFGTYLIQANPQLVGRVSPVIAKIFTPLVLGMLVIYLVAMFFGGKDPYKDREFLLIFNVLLIGVMALIFFSVAGTGTSEKSKAEIWILFLLSLVTIIVNGIALSAIMFRISAWGYTPNRTAVLGSNLLILIHLLVVSVQLFRLLTNKSDLMEVGKAIASYLPVYFLWTLVVTFLFPFLFGFR